jgi:hypothetical protein
VDLGQARPGRFGRLTLLRFPLQLFQVFSCQRVISSGERLRSSCNRRGQQHESKATALAIAPTGAASQGLPLLICTTALICNPEIFEYNTT